MSEAVPAKALQIMEMLPKGGTGLEIGTHTGRFTGDLLKIAEPVEVTLVDPWVVDAELTSRAFGFATTEDDVDAARKHVAATFGARDGVHIVPMKAEAALTFIREAHLDWAWVDGPKHYDILLADLEMLVTRMKPGGVIAGGGYFWAKVLGRPVRAAVRDIADRVAGAELVQEGQYWAIRLPEVVELAPKPDGTSYLVVSTMKNEAPYILEWVAHHRAIGFTDFLVFTNDCDDTTDPILDRIEKLGGLTHQVNEVLKRGPHKSALKYAKDHVLTAKADWILIADVDEFINIKVGEGTIGALLEHLGTETDCVPFPWKVFGHGGVVDFEDKPITRQFLHCEPGPGGRKQRDVKTLFRNPRHMYHFGLHRPRVSEEFTAQTVWKSPSGEDISERMNHQKNWMIPWKGCEDTAYMHHYPVRCVESYILKKNRGRANHINEDLGLEYWDKWDMSGATDRSLKRGHPRFAQEWEALRADPKLRRLHREGVAWHRAQFRALCQDPKYQELYETLRDRKTQDDVA